MDVEPQTAQDNDTATKSNEPPTQDIMSILQATADACDELSLVTSTTPGQIGDTGTNDKETVAVTVTQATNNTSHDPTTACLQPATVDPSLLTAPVQRVARIRTGDKPPHRNVTKPLTPGCDDPNLCLLSDVQEPAWMRKKGTLAYFRSAFKMGGLSTLISNWYRLEGALGFPEQVSPFELTTQRYAYA